MQNEPSSRVAQQFDPEFIRLKKEREQRDSMSSLAESMMSVKIKKDFWSIKE